MDCDRRGKLFIASLFHSLAIFQFLACQVREEFKMVVNGETLRPCQDSHALGKYGLAAEGRKSSQVVSFSKSKYRNEP